MSVRLVVALLPVMAPVIVTLVELATAVVVTLNVALDAPAATVTDAGTVTDALEEVRVTTWPPVGAAPFRVTVPVRVVPLPPSIVEAERLRVETFVVMPSTWLTRPARFRAPQPVAVSHPATAVLVEPLGSVPLLPEVTSKNTEEEPLYEYNRSLIRPNRCLPAELALRPPLAIICCSAIARDAAIVGVAALVPPNPPYMPEVLIVPQL